MARSTLAFEAKGVARSNRPCISTGPRSSPQQEEKKKKKKEKKKGEKRCACARGLCRIILQVVFFPNIVLPHRLLNSSAPKMPQKKKKRENFCFRCPTDRSPLCCKNLSHTLEYSYFEPCLFPSFPCGKR